MCVCVSEREGGRERWERTGKGEDRSFSLN